MLQPPRASTSSLSSPSSLPSLAVSREEERARTGVALSAAVESGDEVVRSNEAAVRQFHRLLPRHRGHDDGQQPLVLPPLFLLRLFLPTLLPPPPCAPVHLPLRPLPHAPSPPPRADTDPAEIEDEDEGSFFCVQIPQDWLFRSMTGRHIGLSAFARIAPLCPIITDVVIAHNLFDALTCSFGGRLHFFVYDKYLRGLDRVYRSVKGITQSPPAPTFHLDAGECILAIDGDKPIHPVLQHIGISAYPSELVD